MEKQTFTRKELYDLVGSEPMFALSRKYNISDVGLRKICIRMRFPLPKAGHWQKLQFGKKVPKSLLPANYTGNANVSLNLRDENNPVPARADPHKLFHFRLIPCSHVRNLVGRSALYLQHRSLFTYLICRNSFSA
jgi:hypothetical protein